jgi:hypothetical protein
MISNMKHRNAKKGSVSIGNLETLAAAEPPRISDFFTERDVARILVVSLGTVRRWRLQGVGPRFHKFQSAVRYAPADVLG